MAPSSYSSSLSQSQSQSYLNLNLNLNHPPALTLTLSLVHSFGHSLSSRLNSTHLKLHLRLCTGHASFTRLRISDTWEARKDTEEIRQSTHAIGLSSLRQLYTKQEATSLGYPYHYHHQPASLIVNRQPSSIKRPISNSCFWESFTLSYLA
jgi:hypothetical protein